MLGNRARRARMTKKTLREWLELENIGPVSNSSYEFAQARALALNIENGFYENDELVEAEKERRGRFLRWIKAMEDEREAGMLR
jgi:hypothetical protein